MAASSLRWTTRQFSSWLRRLFYSDMGRIARAWAPGEEVATIDSAKPATPAKAIRLDFAVPKKHRLFWAHRRVNHLPH